MDNRVVPLRSRGVTGGTEHQRVETVTAVCLRPQCRAEFQRKLTRGRRQDYCSPQCRQHADAERRRSLARLKHYEQNAHLLRTDVSAHEATGGSDRRADAESTDLLSSCSDMQLARAAGRAEAILSVCDRIPDAREALAAELKALVEVVQQHLDPH
jgi:hypothetical protein